MKKFKTIWLCLKRWLWPIAKPGQDFIKWCETPSPKNETHTFKLSGYGYTNPPNDQQSADFFQKIREVLDAPDDANCAIDIHIDYTLACAGLLATSSFSAKKAIRNFSITGHVAEPLRLDSLYVSNLTASHTTGKKIIIENSMIATFEIHPLQLELDIRNTYIGKIILHPGCLKRCDMRGGGIRQIDIQPPGSDNPFTGSIWFANTWFPTDKNMVQGPQPYRNMRHHLRSLSNMQMADLFHALELRTERQQETWTNKAISYLYDWFSDFGASILRPILWLILLGFSVSYILITWDGAVPTRALESSAVGWQTALLGDDIAAPISRGFYLSFYSIIHPLGLFGGQPILVASNPWFSSLLIVEGIFSATLIALTIFALRRRFKVQQS